MCIKPYTEKKKGACPPDLGRKIRDRTVGPAASMPEVGISSGVGDPYLKGQTKSLEASGTS